MTIESGAVLGAAPDLAALERDKYVGVWGGAKYREHSPGERHLRDALAWMRPHAGASITDWGCGTGRAAEIMAGMGYRLRLVDIARNAYGGELPFVEACLWDLPADMPATEFGYCCDVMEHLPTEHVDAALAGIAQRTGVACYLQIALFPHVWGGQQLHLTVKPAAWWAERVSRAFSAVEIKGIGQNHFLALARN